ncbi:transient-receptor-potential-like protein isoform X2 [Copidosoma floridanum]|uniref:transient-receptor-potential-like protein isoform X2 n=1 Tax=Copidosoma floridanum TaxID=29053 RepID=UPI000C6F5D8C|nr:transient-receptor-potential-like protein isoform X2 [Copidosoma floridanum]
MNVNIITITENLFFAIFGQKDTDDFTIALHSGTQPSWTLFLFKFSFSIYMMVTVIVLINLLIAMMSDTYQNIVSQSDIEWKYGLSKLIRNMQKTTMAPSPLNLITSWLVYLHKSFEERRENRKRMSVMNSFIGRRLPKSPFSPNNNIKSAQDSLGLSLLQPSPLGSQLSFRNISNINNVVDWEITRRKYRIRFGGEVEKLKGAPTILDEAP